jgi:hypothetical protein
VSCAEGLVVRVAAGVVGADPWSSAARSADSAPLLHTWIGRTAHLLLLVSLAICEASGLEDMAAAMDAPNSGAAAGSGSDSCL